MSDIKTKYPATSTIAIALTSASLASDSSLLAGRASTAIDNTSNLDLDHLVSGVIRVGASPTVNAQIEIWAYSAYAIASNVPTYPDSITGTDANKSVTSVNVKYSALRIVTTMIVDSVSSRDYFIPSTSIALLFGGMPQYWGLFLVHNTGVALNATQIALQYNRIQAQTV